MAKSSKDRAPQVETAPGFEGHYEELGGYTVGFETYTEESDMAPLFKGLPDDRCQCDHWGYVLKGSFRVTYLDGPEEIVSAGEAYHLRPGHFVQTIEPVELLELSPVEAHDRTMAAVARNMGAAAT